jgi:hypothetical protein
LGHGDGLAQLAARIAFFLAEAFAFDLPQRHKDMKVDITLITARIGGVNGPIDSKAFSCKFLSYKITGEKDVLFEGQFMRQGDIEVMRQ